MARPSEVTMWSIARTDGRASARWDREGSSRGIHGARGEDPPDHRLGRGQANQERVFFGKRNVAVMPRTKLVMPPFKSEGEEAAWWEKHRAAVEADLRAA